MAGAAWRDAKALKAPAGINWHDANALNPPLGAGSRDAAEVLTTSPTATDACAGAACAVIDVGRVLRPTHLR